MGGKKEDPSHRIYASTSCINYLYQLVDKATPLGMAISVCLHSDYTNSSDIVIVAFEQYTYCCDEEEI